MNPRSMSKVILIASNLTRQSGWEMPQKPTASGEASKTSI